jgi:hypothetical protein
MRASAEKNATLAALESTKFGVKLVGTPRRVASSE